MRVGAPWLVAFVAMAALSAAATEVSVRGEAAAAIPVGTPQATYLGVGPEAQVAGLVSLTPFLAAHLQAGYFFTPPTKEGGLLEGASNVLLGAGLRLQRPSRDVQFRPWLDAGLNFHRTGALNRMSLDVGVGLNLRLAVTDSVWFGPQLRYLRVFAFEPAAGTLTVDANVLLAGLGIEFDVIRPIYDTDGDGLDDDKDACPTEAASTADGCPERDPDGDGISGAQDKCPDIKGLVALKGCPDSDDDHDGLMNLQDSCPTATEDKDGFQDADGCPEADNDKDGVADTDDACPNTAGQASANGCPDKDGDGVPTEVDACPNKAGPKDNNGCPLRDQKLIRITESKVEILQKILFVFGKTSIVPRSFPLLDEVAAALADRGNLCVRVEGHTDNVGDPKKNKELSQGRAEAVCAYLTSKGIAANRLTPLGFGQENPLESNTTPAGRENNRRVEFNIVPCPGGTP